MITRINEAKTLLKYISCDCKCEFASTTCNQIKNGIMRNVNVSVKSIIARAKMIIVGILVHVYMSKVSIEKVLLMIQ